MIPVLISQWFWRGYAGTEKQYLRFFLNTALGCWGTCGGYLVTFNRFFLLWENSKVFLFPKAGYSIATTKTNLYLAILGLTCFAIHWTSIWDLHSTRRVALHNRVSLGGWALNYFCRNPHQSAENEFRKCEPVPSMK